MRIDTVYVGDRIPRSAAARAHVTAHCVGARPPQGYICVSCVSEVQTIRNLVEHVGLLLDHSHLIALHCADCFGYHPLAPSIVAGVRDLAILWPASLPNIQEPGA